MTGLIKRMHAAATAAALVLAPVSAAEQGVTCGSHDAIVAYLKQNYSENRQALGLTMDGALIELYVSAGGTWSVLLTVPHGASCLIAAGSDWHTIPPPAAGPEV
jgi:hypothetical protein